MPTTRSATRATAVAAQPTPEAKSIERSQKKSRSSSKRNLSEVNPTPEPKPAKKRSVKSVKPETNDSTTPTVPFEIPPPGDSFSAELLPAKLTFSFEDAKNHLIAADPRFANIFSRLPCKPYEKLERIEPFR